MASEASSSGGIGFFGLLAILFIGLKLAGVVAWGWVWVLAPIWIPIVVILALIALVVAASIIAGC